MEIKKKERLGFVLTTMVLLIIGLITILVRPLHNLLSWLYTVYFSYGKQQLSEICNDTSLVSAYSRDMAFLMIILTVLLNVFAFVAIIIGVIKMKKVLTRKRL